MTEESLPTEYSMTGRENSAAASRRIKMLSSSRVARSPRRPSSAVGKKVSESSGISVSSGSRSARTVISWVPSRKNVPKRHKTHLPALLAVGFKTQSARCLYLRSEEHTSELQSRLHLVCRLLLEKKKKSINALCWLRH